MTLTTQIGKLKIFLALIYFFAVSQCIAQQDLIVKKDSTKIQCTIYKETFKKYKFIFRNSKSKTKKSSVLKSAVASIHIDKFSLDSIASKLAPTQKPAKQELVTKENDTLKYFIFTFIIGLNLENILEYNTPNKPDKKVFSATVALDLGVNYFKEGNSFAMTNEFHWTSSIQKEGTTGSDRIIKTSDGMLTLHDFSVTLSKKSKWNFNLISKSTTALLTTYDGDYFKDYNDSGKNQAFLNPYDITFSPGIKYQPNTQFRISISPYSVNIYGLLDQEIANTGYYTQTFDENDNYSLYVFTKLGAEMNIWFDKKVKKWLEMQYRFGVSSDYLSENNVTGLFDGLFITKFKILKNFGLVHRAVLKGDFVTQPFKPYYKQNILLSFSKSF